MKTTHALALMIGGGVMIALGLPMLFLGFVMYNPSDLYSGSFTLVIGIILFKLGDNWIWNNKQTGGMY